MPETALFVLLTFFVQNTSPFIISIILYKALSNDIICFAKQTAIFPDTILFTAILSYDWWIF